MARNRSRSGSTISITNGHQARVPTSSPQLKRQFAAAIDEIYHNNMTVLRRRDPTIVSILDSFSHVCLYHFKGTKWEKSGYEGSMFLVQHEDAPHYGLFILNRMGTGDWGRRIYAEDDMQILGDYLMYRYYPDFTSRRSELGLPYPLPSQWRSTFDLEFAHDANDTQADDQASAGREKKGNSATLGLWMFPTDAREPLKDVLIRLHSYVKRGLEYPKEFHYGPGRPAPPNPHLRRASLSSNTEDEDTPRLDRTPHTIENSGNSEVDKLFAKLQPKLQQQPQVSANTAQTTTSQSMSAQHWFAALTEQTTIQASNSQSSTSVQTQLNVPSRAPSTITTTTTTATTATSTSTRGLALLDSIFASVQPSPVTQTAPSIPTAPSAQDDLPPHPEEIQIVSPKPQSNALPQILNQDVILNLLGLASDLGSRASSAAPSATSSRRSGLNRYEGDNEFSDRDSVSEASYSATGTVADSDPAILAVGRSGVPCLSISNGSSDSGSEGHREEGSSRRPEGDLTPRVPARGIDQNSPPPMTLGGSKQFLLPANGLSRKPNAKDSFGAKLNLTASSSSTSTVTAKTAAKVESSSSSTITTEAAANQRSQRLVPFEADSELWPYPRAALDEHTPENDNDVVELDFSDTRALSDPTTFSAHLQKQKRKKDKGKRKTKEERATEKQRERDAIEKSWDDPTGGQGVHVDMTSQPGAPTLTKPPAPVVNGVLNGKHRREPSGSGVGSSPSSANGFKSDLVNGYAVKDALLSSLLPHPKAPKPDISRKHFVQEVLTLIYSDSAFVDKLYEEYLSRAQ